MLTTAIGALIQHDASQHRWSPYAKEKWALITSLDDFSRKILYADFVEQETTWAHIKAAERVMLTYGIPLRYYVDSLRAFRFVQGRDSVWRKHVLQTDEADPQWRQVMRGLGVDVVYALSPQAKGKIERPYRWLQDRIVRTCAIEKISAIDDVRAVLKAELDRYNNHQVHSTTGEVPSIRFARARKEGNSLFRPFALPKPYSSTKDVFCLREKRTVNGYRKISLSNHDIPVPHVPLREEVEVHLIPDVERGVLEVRIWCDNRWLQDRIVRTCAIEKLTTIEEVRAILKEELDRYNNHQVHSTTGEVPSIHFEKARKEGNSLFRPFALPKPYTSANDVFCLRETRMVNGYRKISLSNHEIAVPNMPLREEVDV